MSWTFIADSNNQLTLSDALAQAADNFDLRKKEMYGKIDNMGDHWKGDDYDLFNSSAHNYDNALQDFSDSIRMYSDQFEKVSVATEQLATELIDIIMNMTGSANAGGTGGPGTGGTGGTGGGAATPGAEPRKWYQKIGDRFAADWSDFTGDVARAWGRADGLISGAVALGITGVEAVNFLGDVAISTVNATVDVAQTGINWLLDGGQGREYSFGQDMAENWDFSTVDNFGEGVGVALTGVVRTGVDLVQGAVNLGCNVVKSVGTGLKKAKDAICDFGSSILGGIASIF